MYLKSFTAKNLKCFRDVTLTMPEEDGYAGWHVILGGNGVGKSTLLQGIALASMDVVAASVLNRQVRFIRQGGGNAEAELSVHTTALSYNTRLRYSPVSRAEEVSSVGRQVPLPHNPDPNWFLVVYGPFRRFTGPEQNEQDLHPIVARLETMFNEGAARTRREGWLKDLYASSLDEKLGEAQAKAKADLAIIKRTLNVLLKSQKVELRDISTKAVTFMRSGTGIEVQLHQLSDGYRSFLSMVIDLLRRITETGRLRVDEQQRIRCEGVVLIDEVDTYLHPRWQREIGEQLCAVFPDLQFIVTTHSPFVAQSARPGGLFVLEAEGEAVIITQPLDSVRGMRADQILTSPLFDLLSTRDLETEEKLQAREKLMAKETLSVEERAELKRLEDWLSQRMSTPGDTFKEYQHYAKMQRLLANKLDFMDET
ncbi:AAA family ATPase [Myxococcota bacterium]|nr:AAA family ATPase [Myxococcota bacterium]